MLDAVWIHRLRQSSKSFVAKAGPDNRRLDVLYNLPKVDSWRREHVPDDCPVFPERADLHRYLQQDVIGDAPVDFLEFGVFEGESIRDWSERITHPDARFVGFDSFEGLPEDWQRIDGQMGASAFDIGGAIPQIADPRVSFVKGLFQDTLGDFLDTFVPKSQVFLHNDSDLYSSTLYTLSMADRILAPGSIVLFDEFSSVLNEFRALEDYCSAYRRSYDVIGVAGIYYAQVAILMH